MSKSIANSPAFIGLMVGGLVLGLALGAMKSKPPAPTRHASQAFTCKAAMGYMFGYPAFHMRASQSGSKTRITWRAKSDGKKWQTNCWLQTGSQIMWQSIRADGSVGRVRDHTLDSKLTWSSTPTTISIKEVHSDGSQDNKQYSIPKGAAL